MCHKTLWLALGLITSFASGQATQPVNEYRPGGYPETYGGVFYPGIELRALPGARAQAIAARGEFRRAQQDLDNAIDDIRRDIFRTVEYRDAQIQQRDAFARYQAIRQEVVQRLQSNPNYEAAVELRSQLANQIEAIRLGNTLNVQRLLAAATVKLSCSVSASAMEAQALSADARIAEARQRLIDASARLAAFQEQFDRAVRSSPAVLAQRRHVQDARIAAAASDALYAEAARVANVAMDYAYHIYDQPYPQVINTGYSPYYQTPYSYPVGYPVGYPGVGWWRDRNR